MYAGRDSYPTTGLNVLFAHLDNISAAELASRESISLEEAKRRLADAARLKEAFEGLSLDTLEGLAEWLEVHPDVLTCWVELSATMPSSTRRSLSQKIRYLDPAERRRQGRQRRLDLDALDRDQKARELDIPADALDRRLAGVRDFHALQDQLGATQAELARELDVPLASLEKWLQLRRPIPGPVRQLVSLKLDDFDV
jgi:transcriptional regulator with XRE-family HTH domain